MKTEWRNWIEWKGNMGKIRWKRSKRRKLWINFSNEWKKKEQKYNKIFHFNNARLSIKSICWIFEYIIEEEKLPERKI